MIYKTDLKKAFPKGAKLFKILRNGFVEILYEFRTVLNFSLSFGSYKRFSRTPSYNC